jgi:hypothetical protein
MSRPNIPASIFMPIMTADGNDGNEGPSAGRSFKNSFTTAEIATTKWITYTQLEFTKQYVMSTLDRFL